MSGRTDYLSTLLRGEFLREFEKLASQNAGTTSAHLNFIQEVLLGFFLINALSNQKREIRRAMRKPPDLPFKRFDARLTGLNNYLPIFPGSSASNNMSPEELNEIILQTVLNVWSKKSYLQGWGFEGKTYKGTCDMF